MNLVRNLELAAVAAFELSGGEGEGRINKGAGVVMAGAGIAIMVK